MFEEIRRIFDQIKPDGSTGQLIQTKLGPILKKYEEEYRELQVKHALEEISYITVNIGEDQYICAIKPFLGVEEIKEGVFSRLGLLGKKGELFLLGRDKEYFLYDKKTKPYTIWTPSTSNLSGVVFNEDRTTNRTLARNDKRVINDLLDQIKEEKSTGSLRDVFFYKNEFLPLKNAYKEYLNHATASDLHLENELFLLFGMVSESSLEKRKEEKEREVKQLSVIVDEIKKIKRGSGMIPDSELEYYDEEKNIKKMQGEVKTLRTGRIKMDILLFQEKYRKIEKKFVFIFERVENWFKSNEYYTSNLPNFAGDITTLLKTPCKFVRNQTVTLDASIIQTLTEIKEDCKEKIAKDLVNSERAYLVDKYLLFDPFIKNITQNKGYYRIQSQGTDTDTFKIGNIWNSLRIQALYWTQPKSSTTVPDTIYLSISDMNCLFDLLWVLMKARIIENISGDISQKFNDELKTYNFYSTRHHLEHSTDDNQIKVMDSSLYDDIIGRLKDKINGYIKTQGLDPKKIFGSSLAFRGRIDSNMFDTLSFVPAEYRIRYEIEYSGRWDSFKA